MQGGDERFLEKGSYVCRFSRKGYSSVSAEMVRRQALFLGDSELQQLLHIFRERKNWKRTIRVLVKHGERGLAKQSSTFQWKLKGCLDVARAAGLGGLTTLGLGSNVAASLILRRRRSSTFKVSWAIDGLP
ncbi:uncharacterized protein LOC131246510 isoform X3 [Magnolia sinica]|uniref:uncharacterized protein LOC131246510 isoform X3 n=1 Tax=Magnolia sinica TaxID=86752 RepID=UPI002659F63E|nr:uncharacterized protein LOC131246510 isoform X3 [Magnolia sinica]